MAILVIHWIGFNIHLGFRIRILADRTSVETFANDGEVVMPTCYLPDDNHKGLELFASGGAARIRSLAICPMRSIWR